MEIRTAASETGIRPGNITEVSVSVMAVEQISVYACGLIEKTIVAYAPAIGRQRRRKRIVCGHLHIVRNIRIAEHFKSHLRTQDMFSCRAKLRTL